MIPAAFKYQGRFPSAALVVPSGFARYAKTSIASNGSPPRA
jgi:hypothetical protein